MKIRLLPCCVAFALAIGPLLRAQDAMAPAPAAPAAAPDKEVKTELETKMSKISRAMRALRKQAADASKNDSSLKLVATMEAGITASMDLTPAKAADLPDDQKPQFIADYKAGLKGMLEVLTKLEGDFKAGNNDDAVKVLAEVAALEKKDHKAFQTPKAN
jgi:hypothetical protein